MLCRQEGTGWLGSKDRRETSVEVPQPESPPIIMRNWVGETVVVVAVVVVGVVVEDEVGVLCVEVLVVVDVGVAVVLGVVTC